MNNNSDNSINTNNYRKKVTLSDIDIFLYDVNHDTDNIIRDFHSNKLVMINYFNDISKLYQGYEESILLFIYLVICMKKKLIDLDKKIEQNVFNYLLKKDIQSAGTLDSYILELLIKELPLAFESIYSQYAMCKLRLIQNLLTTKSNLYLDEILYVPVTNLTTQIVSYEEKNYFNSYNNFYDKIMMYIKNEVLKIEYQFKNNNLNELYRYYLYRKIIEFDIKEETYKNKNDTLREYIVQNKSAYDIMKMLYGSIYEDTVRYNVVDEFRTKVTENSNSIILIMNILEKQVTKAVQKDSITYYSKTFDRLTDKVTKMLEHKQSAGMFLRNEVIPKQAGKPDLNTIYRERINKILYTVLRGADTKHDFLFDEKRPSAEFQKNKNEYLKSIKFIPKLEFTEVGKKAENQKKNYDEILTDLYHAEIFSKLFIIGDQKDILDIDLEPLLEAMEKKSDFEDNIMAQMNRFIYNVCQLDFSPDAININGEFLKVYRPGNFILEKILKSNFMSPYLNTAQYINKKELFNLENRDFDETKISEIFKKEELDNLLFVIYDDSILNDDAVNKQKRKEIINTVKKFFGTDSVKLLVDYGQKSGPFFKIFTKDNDIGKDVFLIPKFSLAQEWDAATKRTYHLNTTEEPQILNTDLLDKENNIPICEKDYKVTLERKDDRVIAHADINVYELDKGSVPIDSKNFTPSVNILSDLISDKKATEAIRCKLFYLKNSGDWGQVTSANQNKSFLLSEDRLCSYYSFLTNTSTIYTMERGSNSNRKFITMIHRGDIDMSWQNIIEIIQKTLSLNNYYIFYNNITITLKCIYKLSSKNKTDIYKITYTLIKENVTYKVKKNNSDIPNADINSELQKISKLKVIQITQIIYTKDSTDMPINDNVIIKDETDVNNSIPITISKQIENHSLIKKQEERCLFLVKNKCNDDYEKMIYSNFFDKFYSEILDPSLVQPTDESTADKLKRVVREEIINYISENIMIIYLSFLNSDKNFLDQEEKEECKEGNDCIGKNKHNICTKKYRATITSFFNTLNLKTAEKYKLEYIDFDNELNWKLINELVIDPEETYEINIAKMIESQIKIKETANAEFLRLSEELKQTKKEDPKNEEKIEELTKNKSKAYKLKNYNPKILDYKNYNMADDKRTIVNDLSLYKYKNSEQNVFISSMLTNGLWDIIHINPFIYSLYSKFLSIYPNLIPKCTDKDKITRIQNLYFKIYPALITPEILQTLSGSVKKTIIDLKDFMLGENHKYRFDIIPQRGITAETYIDSLLDFLDKGFIIYELGLFSYLYDFITPIEIAKKEENIFKTLENSSDTANIDLIRDRKDNKSNRVIKPFVGEYLKMLKDLLPKEDTDILVSLSSPDSPIVLYFRKILEELDITKHKEMMISEDNVLFIITNYVTKLKELKDVEYYSEIINILKSIKDTLKNNEIYIDEKNSIKTTVLWFIDMLYGYLSDYDKIEYIKNMNEFQYCKLTRQLLEKIKESIKDHNVLKHIYNFLIEVLKKDLPADMPNLFVVHNNTYTRCSNIVATYHDLYNEEDGSECTLESVEPVVGVSPKSISQAEDELSEDSGSVVGVSPKSISQAEDELSGDHPSPKNSKLSACIKKIIGDKEPKCIPGINPPPNTLTIANAKALLKCKNIDDPKMTTKKQLCPALIENGLIPDPSKKFGGQIDYNKECQIM
jgi:hypothetical protein